MIRKLIYGIIILLFFSLSSSAQFVNFGQDRSSIKWKQINTDHFQLIYPDFFESNAQKIANIYEQLYRHANTLKLQPKKISMILHANGGVSNGNVALAPRKSELYTMPSQEPSDAWLEHLCVHEFRHVVQLDKVNQGLTKGLYYIFGEVLPIAVYGLYVPMWFTEGDAVCFETAVGNLGRGRSPEFLNEMKAQVVEKGVYPFYKAIVGSYKDFVPNRYTMGYFMTGNSKINYGPDIWAKALERTGRRPFGIVPFSKSIKQTMQGRRDSLWNDTTFRSLFVNPDSVRNKNTYPDAKRTLYHDNFSELGQIWKRAADTVTDRFDTISTRNKYYANYYYPTPLPEGGIIAYKKGLQQTGEFVLLGHGKEKTLTLTGILDDYKFSVNDGKIVWAEYRPNIRWEQGGRMTICSYDLKHKRYERHRADNNRFAPFPVGNHWGCVEVNDRNEASIVMLDSTFLHETGRFPAPQNELYIHPSYIDGKIVTVVQTTSGIHLEEIDPTNGNRQKIYKSVPYELDNPCGSDSLLIFRASFNGNNSLYTLDRKSGKILNILNSPFGINFPAITPHRDSLYFSFYTSDGYKPGKAKLASLQGKPFSMEQFRLADSLRIQENWQLPLNADSVYLSRKYRKFTHLVNIHSWGPLAVDLNNREVDLGLVVYSQNKLSTLSFMAGYLLKSGFDHGAWVMNATYSGWWPVFDLNFESGKDFDRFRQIEARHLPSGNNQTMLAYGRFWTSSADLTMRLPLNLSRKNYNRYIQPYVRYKIEGLHNFKTKNLYGIIEKELTYSLYEVNPHDYKYHVPAPYYQLMEYGIKYNNQTQMTDQESNPRWGQMLAGGYTHAPLENMDLGNQWWAESRLYSPGFFKNHSVSAYGGFQHMSEKVRNYSNKILYPRGISLNGYEIASFRGTYRMPLLYPDQNISSILYIKGVDGAVFFDTGTSRNKQGKETYYSSGIELTADTHVFRLTYPIHIGVRTGYETQHRSMFTNLIFSIGLSI